MAKIVFMKPAKSIEEFRQLAEEGQKKINQIDAGNAEIDKLKMNLSGRWNFSLVDSKNSKGNFSLKLGWQP